MKLYIIVSSCIALAFGTTDQFPQCKKNDPEIEKCFLDGIEAVRPRLKDGIPEIKLPSLEPFQMDFLNINTDIVKADLSNLKVDGASDFNIEYLKVNLDNTYAAEIKLVFPQLVVTTDYSILGSKTLFFIVKGSSGKFKVSISGVSVVVKCVASPVAKNDVDYLQLDSIVTEVSIGKGEIEVDPAGFSFTGLAASVFVKSNPSVVLDMLSPVIDATIAIVVKQYLNDILANVPLKDVLIDS